MMQEASYNVSPVPERHEPLSAFDLQQFEQLIAQEGYSIGGQVRRLQMIRPFISARVENLKRERRRELAAQRMSEGAINTTIHHEFQPLQYEMIEVNRQPCAVVVEKSSVPAGRRADYTIMMPQHVDTIRPRWPSFEPQSLERSPVDERSGRMSNLGVFDMGQGVANAIAIMAKVRVPEGMRLYAVFTRGEETPQSSGANALFRHWSGMRDVDLVLSSEIGPTDDDDLQNADDRAMRYIVARPGRVRVFAKVSLLDEARGHASIPGLPNAKRERDRLATMLEDIYTGEQSHGFDYGLDHAGNPRTSLLLNHSRLGSEWLDPGKEWYPENKEDSLQMDDIEQDDTADMQGRDTDYVHIGNVHCKFYVRIVPPNTREKVIEQLQSVHAHIAAVRQWAAKGIKSKIELFDGEQSYSPFAMPGPEKNDAIRIAHDVLTKIAGVPAVPVHGHSVADENLYAEALQKNLFEKLYVHGSRNVVTQDDLPASYVDPFVDSDCAVISIPPKGSRAHSPYEWLDVDDMARVRHAIMRLLQDSDGFSQLLEARRHR